MTTTRKTRPRQRRSASKKTTVKPRTRIRAGGRWYLSALGIGEIEKLMREAHEARGRGGAEHIIRVATAEGRHAAISVIDAVAAEELGD